MFCFCFLFIYFKDSCQSNLNVCRTDLRQIFTDDRSRTMAVNNQWWNHFFDPLRDVAMTTNFCWFDPQNWFSSRQWLVAQPGGLTLRFAVHLQRPKWWAVIWRAVHRKLAITNVLRQYAPHVTNKLSLSRIFRTQCVYAALAYTSCTQRGPCRKYHLGQLDICS